MCYCQLIYTVVSWAATIHNLKKKLQQFEMDFLWKSQSELHSYRSNAVH